MQLFCLSMGGSRCSTTEQEIHLYLLLTTDTVWTAPWALYDSLVAFESQFHVLRNRIILEIPPASQNESAPCALVGHRNFRSRLPCLIHPFFLYSPSYLLSNDNGGVKMSRPHRVNISLSVKLFYFWNKVTDSQEILSFKNSFQITLIFQFNIRVTA